MQETGGFIVSEEMRSFLSRPGYLKVSDGGQRLRDLYQQQSKRFHPQLLYGFAQQCYLGRYGIVKEMVESGMAPDLTGTETPYQFGYVTLVISGAQRAVERPSDINYPAALKYLLKSRAPPDVPDIVGYSALQHATMNHLAMVDLARLLLEHGADPNHRNRYGEVALIPAFEGNQHGIIDLLLEFGADLNIPEADGLAPTQLFLRYGPQVTVTVRKWMRRRAGEQAPMSDKKCDGCGKEDDQLKMFPLPLCALLHSGLPACSMEAT